VTTNSAERTKHIKKLVKEQSRIEERKVVVFEHSAEKACELANGMCDDTTLPNEAEAIYLTGREGSMFKTYVIHTFCEAENNCKVLVGTSAMKCGINCWSCGAVLQSGFPVNIQSYAQQNGRAGRGGVRHETDPYICSNVVSIESFNHIFLQNQEYEQKAIKAEKTRQFEEVLELMIIPKQCIHQAIENRLEILRGRNTDTEEDDIFGPCGYMCWYCRNEDMIPIDSRDDLKSVLEILLGDGNIESVDLPKLLLVESGKLWKSYLAPRESELRKETILRERDVRASCSSLVLKLLATKILTPTKVDLKSNEKPTVVLRWGRREKNGRIELAYRSAIGWDNIPESTHLSNNYR
jgi:hypothetical protein